MHTLVLRAHTHVTATAGTLPAVPKQLARRRRRKRRRGMGRACGHV
jgi:hypothetical protein